MKNDYISINEAIILSNKSRTTLIRLANELKETKNIKKEGNKYLISKIFLINYFDIPSQNYATSKAEPGSITQNNNGYPEIIALLKEMLQGKDKIISDQSQHISSLIERSREQNIIIQTLQNRLAITETSDVKQADKTFWDKIKDLFIEQ